MRTKQGPARLRGVVIRDPEQALFHRLLFVAPSGRWDGYREGFRRATYSFAKLDAAEAEALRPLRVRLHKAGPGDSLESLAARTDFARLAAERLRVLNGLDPGEGITPGRLVKLVREGRL